MLIGTLLLSALAAAAPIRAAQIMRAAGDRVVVAASDRPAAEPVDGTRLILVADGRPLGWFTLALRQDGEAVFRRDSPVEIEPGVTLSAWLVAPDTGARLLRDWPPGGPLVAPIDRVGPGARSAWVRAGGNQGVRADDHWWLRFGGQPVARFDVRSVEPEVCYCAVVPLAAELPLRAGLPVELWPTPAERRSGSAQTAVAFVERHGEALVVWVAAPPQAACPAEPHLDFYHLGRYVGHGVVEARDDEFWYARFVSAAGRPAAAASQPMASAPSTSASAPHSRPATREASPAVASAPSEPSPVQVGDTAIVRTQADIERRRFVARVFDTSPEGALINAGEDDGLRSGQVETLVRDGVEIGRVEVARVQRGYAVIRSAGDENGLSPRPGDEIRFGPGPAAPVAVAVVEDVEDAMLFSALVAGAADSPTLTPLAVREGDRAIGVAVLLAVDGPRACGFAVAGGLRRPIRPGDELAAPAGIR